MKTVIFSSVFSLCSLIGISQGFQQGIGGSNNILRETDYKSVDGSPYLFDDWKSGAIRDKKGSLTENLMIRYDGYRDEVQFLKDGKTLVVEPSLAAEFYFVSLNSETKLLENKLFRNGFSVEGYSKLNYFQVLYEGKVQFIKKVRINYMEENVKNYGTNELVKKFIRNEYEFLIVDGNAQAIGKGRKDLLEKLGNSAELKSYVKQNRLNLKDDGDLAKVLKKYEDINK